MLSDKLKQEARSHGLRITQTKGKKRVQKPASLLREQIKRKDRMKKKRHSKRGSRFVEKSGAHLAPVSYSAGNKQTPGVPFFNYPVPFQRAPNWFYPVVNKKFQL